MTVETNAAAEDVLRRKEAASWLGVAPETLSRWAKVGKIKAYKIGSRAVGFKLIDLQGLLIEQEVG